MDDLGEKVDKDIAKNVQSGNVGVFGILVERYKQKMKRCARRFLLGKEAGRENLGQVDFVKRFLFSLICSV